MVKYVGMSIPETVEKGNIWERNIFKNVLMAFLFISFCLISFAIGRISALDEFSVPDTDVIITNTNTNISN